MAQGDGVVGEGEGGRARLHGQGVAGDAGDAHALERGGQGDVEIAVVDGAFDLPQGEAVDVQLPLEPLQHELQRCLHLIGTRPEVRPLAEPVHVGGGAVLGVLDDGRQHVHPVHLQDVLAAPDALGALHRVVDALPLLGPGGGVGQVQIIVHDPVGDLEGDLQAVGGVRLHRQGDGVGLLLLARAGEHDGKLAAQLLVVVSGHEPVVAREERVAVGEPLAGRGPARLLLQFGVDLGWCEVRQEDQGDVVVVDGAVVLPRGVTVQVHVPRMAGRGRAAVVRFGDPDEPVDALPRSRPLQPDGERPAIPLTLCVLPIRVVEVDVAVVQGRGLEPGREFVHAAGHQGSHPLAGSLPGGSVVLHAQALPLAAALGHDGRFGVRAWRVEAGGPVVEPVLEAGVADQVPGLAPIGNHQGQVVVAFQVGGGGLNVHHVADAVGVDVTGALVGKWGTSDGAQLHLRLTPCRGGSQGGEEEKGQEQPSVYRSHSLRNARSASSLSP